MRQGGKRIRKIVRPIRNRAGAETNNKVTSVGQPRDHLRQCIGAQERFDAAMAMGAEPFDQGVSIDPFDRCFARRVHIGDDYRVGIVEAGTKIIEQIHQAAVAVGLHHGNDTATRG